MIGDCAWCGGPLRSADAVTLFGPWTLSYLRISRLVAEGVPQQTIPVWCGVPCREASGSPALSALA